jgi:hypothetical protein
MEMEGNYFEEDGDIYEYLGWFFPIN